MISVGFKTDKGVIRGDNEDSLFVMPEQNLYIVADGVGGHNSGQLASRMAVGYMAQYVALNPLTKIKSKVALRGYFKKCIEGANQLVHEKASYEAGNRGMATTIVLTYIKDGWAYVVNVGDSRAYLIRDGEINQITEDHTCVRELLNKGLISEEEAENHPDKNMITRAIGGESDICPDFFRFEVFPGDVIIMCTDGLYDEVNNDCMVKLAGETNSMHDLATNLIDEANMHGGKDNISVICISVQ